MANTNLVYLDARMATFQGEPVRILSAFDMRNNTILVSSILPFRPSNDESKLSKEDIEKKRAIQNQSLIITDSPDSFDNYDIAFNPNEHLDQAAHAYMTYNRQGVLIIQDELKGRANVDAVLDAKNLELTKGMVWHLNPQRTNNLHIAVLGLCYGAKRATGGAGMLDMLHDQDGEQDVIDDSVMPFTI